MSAKANLSPGHLIPHAWQAFKSRPGLCIVMTMIFGFLSPGSTGGGGSGSGSTGGDSLSNEAMILLLVLVAFALLIMLVQAIVAGPIRGGYELAMLRISRGDETVVFGDLFKGFSKFLPLLITFFLVTMIIGFGFILCIVPGIIAMISLWPAYLLVMEDDLSPTDAIKGAWELTNGYKLNLFVLGLANFGVLILGGCACCVGVFVALPVTQLAWIGAYHEMRMAAGTVATPEAEPVRKSTAGLPPPVAMGPGDDLYDEDEQPTQDLPIPD